MLIGQPEAFKARSSRSLAFHLSNPQNLNTHSYVLNNPVKYTDPDGEIIPLVLVAAWAVTETALSAYDIYSAAQTTVDPNASLMEKGSAIGFAVAGVALPGGGYGAAANGARQAVSTANNVAKGLKVGQTFGKLGRVVDNVGGRINSFDQHALLRMEQRNVDRGLMDNVVSNPLITLKQARNRTLYLTREAAVVLDNTGKAITTYTKNEFKPHVLNILKSVKGK